MSTLRVWDDAPARWIAPREVHVFGASLDRSPSELAGLAQTLSPAERARAERFRFRRDRERFVAGRGLLRRLLGEYLGQAAEAVRLTYTAYGKPRVEGPLSFNVSHSENRALYAVGPGCELGVDIERLHAAPAEEKVAEHFFAPAEVAVLRSLPREAQPRAFLSCWTRKEAYVKGRGEGLNLPLDDFEVMLAPGGEPALLRTAWSADEPEEWTLVDLSAWWPGYVAALAVRGRGLRILVEEEL